MVSVLDFGSKGPTAGPGRDTALCSCLAQVHPGVEMGSGEFNARGKPSNVLASHSGGSRTNTASHFILWKPGVCSGLMGHKTRRQTLPFYSRGYCGWGRELLLEGFAS